MVAARRSCIAPASPVAARADRRRAAQRDRETAVLVAESLGSDVINAVRKAWSSRLLRSPRHAASRQQKQHVMSLMAAQHSSEK